MGHHPAREGVQDGDPEPRHVCRDVGPPGWQRIQFQALRSSKRRATQRFLGPHTLGTPLGSVGTFRLMEAFRSCRRSLRPSISRRLGLGARAEGSAGGRGRLQRPVAASGLPDHRWPCAFGPVSRAARKLRYPLGSTEVYSVEVHTA